MSRVNTYMCLVVVTVGLCLGQSQANAAMQLISVLTGDQEVPAVTTTAVGTAILELNNAGDELSYLIQFTGLDLGGQTVDTDDDVIGLHIHNAPAGSNGGIVFGIIGSPSQGGGTNPALSDDLDDRVINSAFQVVSGVWDADDNTSLASVLDDLRNGNLYLNAHTNRVRSGEIRGQIIPEPASAVMLLGGALLAATARRRRPVG